MLYVRVPGFNLKNRRRRAASPTPETKICMSTL